MTSIGESPHGVLACSGVSIAFGGTRALTDVSVQFPPSGVVAVIGPNGAGKTTLLNVLSGFLRPDTGRCLLHGRDVTTLPPYQLARAGVARTFQELRLVRKVTVLENVLLARPNQRGEGLWGALFRRGVAAEEARNVKTCLDLLTTVGLGAKVAQLAETLSYGQQKRLSLACCLATSAQVLFLDEPVAGVDPAAASDILDSVTRLRGEGKLVVIIEHDIAAVRRVADTVLVMDGGKVIASGAPGEVLSRPEIMEVYLA